MNTTVIEVQGGKFPGGIVLRHSDTEYGPIVNTPTKANKWAVKKLPIRATLREAEQAVRDACRA